MKNIQIIKLFLLIVVLLLGVAKAQEEATNDAVSPIKGAEDEGDDNDDAEPAEKETTPAPQETHKPKETVAPSVTTIIKTTTAKISKPTTQAKTQKPAPAPAPAPAKTDNKKTSAPAPAAAATSKKATSAAKTQDKASPAAKSTATSAAGNSIAPPITPNANTAGQQISATTGNNAVSNAVPIIEDGNKTEESGESGGVVTKVVIGLVGVCAVAGVATVGVRAYNKKNNTEDDEIHMMSAVEAQEEGSAIDGPEKYNAYNIMNNLPNEPYMMNSPYETKPQYQEAQYEDNLTTTPFEKSNVDDNSNNYMARDSIFSNSGNIPQIGNDVLNFDNKLPYIQEYNETDYNTSGYEGYEAEPISREVQEENYSMPRSQMPTLVPVQPEITVTPSEEENVEQEGYKQIIPKVAQMEIIDTPDYNNMTQSMIEDHINTMELEQLANTDQPEDQTEGYKQIVPDIQEAVIENFPDIEEEEEEIDASAVTDTYRAALRATYCSATDDNRFSYRTVDSDHSLLHNMRENGQW